MDLDRTERRVVGALVEKRWTTPDQYPLSLNALVAACNQKSNRDPVLELEPFEVEGCVLGLRTRGLMTQHESYTGRVPRFSEKFLEAISLSRRQGAILAELMLRGPQTAPELHRRCRRMSPFDGEDEVYELLREMATLRLVNLLPRASRERHARWEHLVAPASEREGAAEEAAPAESDEGPTPSVVVPQAGVAIPVASAPGPVTHTPNAPATQDPVADLRAQVVALCKRVDTLERELGLGSDDVAEEGTSGRAPGGPTSSPG